MSASRMYGSKIYEEKLDALSLQLSNTSTLVENSLGIAAPHELFEGGEYYDPLATWTPEEESKVKMKTDVRLLGWLSVMYFDSTSMANALADNFLHDLGFDMTEYGNIAKALSSLIAAGILNMRGIGGKPGWFYLLLINGLVVFVIGIISVLYLPAGPTRTQSVLYRKPWFSEREKGNTCNASHLQDILMLVVIVINRLLRDDVSKGKTSTKEKTSLRDIWNTLKDPALIGFWFLALIIYMGKSPVSQYLVLNLRQLGFTRFESTVLTIPSDFLRTVTVLALTWSSGHFKEKVFHCIIPGCIEIPLFAALLILPPHGYSWVRFTIITLIISSPSSHPIMASWISVNSFDPKKRGITIALFGTFHEIGSIAAAQIYRDDDKPYYYTGNKVLISICAVSIVGLLIHREVLKHINRKKKRAWESLSEVEQREYSRNQEHSIGNKSLTFRFYY
ncbi:putative MFS transporter [Aureobasidium pullulans]|uniref:Putative MFS transporter n=1 Tax=Aureobasidium pullulans TaxID=5580 RepID=A0A4S9D1P1_AURPU|nr:putative MFS transporter [Aureobasidium pullulans]